MLPRASQSTDVNSWLTRVSCMCPQIIRQMIHTFTYFKLFLRDAKTSPKQTVKGGSCSRPLTSCDPTSHKQSVTVLTAWQLMQHLQALAAAKVTPQCKVNWRNENNKVQDSKQSQWKVACILQAYHLGCRHIYRQPLSSGYAYLG